MTIGDGFFFYLMDSDWVIAIQSAHGVARQKKRSVSLKISGIQRSKKKLVRKLSIQTWISSIKFIPFIACFLCMLTVNG